ncbi:DUF2778 domain-containing protein [Patescibacteria group bacterium]|nr:DUF2778 domain-containing protein [Patescibacteria group bacterium]
MSKAVYIKIEGEKLKIEDRVFKIKTRKQDLIKKKDPYWKNGGPCPPGEYYLFYRYREENGRIRDRLELCQDKPKKVIVNEDNNGNINILKKQSFLKFKKSDNRINIQIHGGSKSKGCFVINNYKELYKIVLDLFKKGIIVKIKVDDYWKTEKGKREIKEYK